MRTRGTRRCELRDTADLAKLRSWLREELATLDVDASWLCDVLLATQEAAANALKCDRSGRRAVKVILRIGSDCVWVEVLDSGPGFEFGAACGRRPSPDSASGRGLYLMTALMDVLEVSSRPSGSRVRMGKRLPATEVAIVCWDETPVAI